MSAKQRGFLRCIFASGLITLCLALMIPAAEVTLDYTDISDSYVYHWASTTNYGNATILAIDGHRNSLMHFDLTGISGTVDSARLTLNVHANTAGEYIYIAPLSRSFAEGAVSWDSAQAGVAWSSGGGDFDSCGGSWCDTSTATQDSYDSEVYISSGSGGGLAAIIQDWIDGDNHGFLLQASYSTTINSSEASNADRRPSLYISYTTDTTESEFLRRRRLLLGDGSGGERDGNDAMAGLSWSLTNKGREIR